MNQRAGWDIFLFLLTEFLYVWSASRFLRTHLQGKSREGRVFGGLLFGSHIVMVFFLENPGRIFSREQLLIRFWGYDFDGNERVVDNHIKKLRKAIDGCGCSIQTVRKSGYRMEVGE